MTDLIDCLLLNFSLSVSITVATPAVAAFVCAEVATFAESAETVRFSDWFFFVEIKSFFKDEVKLQVVSFVIVWEFNDVFEEEIEDDNLTKDEDLDVEWFGVLTVEYLSFKFMFSSKAKKLRVNKFFISNLNKK